jgi:hypothetical protein
MDVECGADNAVTDPPPQSCPSDEVVRNVSANCGEATADSLSKRLATSLEPSP